MWSLLLSLLLGSALLVLFSWCAVVTLDGDTRFGALGRISLKVAEFPSLIGEVFEEINSGPDRGLRVPRPKVDLVKFRPVQMRSDISVQGLMVRADKVALARAAGWRLLIGVFAVEGKLQNAILALSPNLEVVRVWVVSKDKTQTTTRSLAGVIHGFSILKNGSMIFAFQPSGYLQRIDRCGKPVWSTNGEFNHTVSVEDGEKSLWTLLNTGIDTEVVNVSSETGQVIRRIPIAAIIAANPTIDILEVGKYDDWNESHPHNSREKWFDDPLHFNDVEPLPAAIATRFPGFKAGDLLLSASSLNLVFVMDPETLKVKWWQSGSWRRQYDPDWQPTGEITVLDNNRGRGYSRIVSINPLSRGMRVLFDGNKNDFYTRESGKHQITGNGNLLVTSAMQGRAFEVEPNGNMVFDILNTKPGSNEFNYYLSEAVWLPLDSFDFSGEISCAK